MAMFYKIVLFIFLFNVSLSIINQINIFPLHSNINPRSNWTGGITQEVNSTFNTQQIPGIDILGGMLKGLILITRTLFGAIIVFPMFYEVLGGNACAAYGGCGIIDTIVASLTIVVWLIYGIALAQYLRGVSMKTME